MSVELKKDLLVGISIWIGIAYMILSVLGARIFIVIGHAVDDRYLNGKAVPLAVMGAALFLFGCGVFHIFLATYMMPQGIDTFGSASMWMELFPANLIILGAQAVGAPLLLISGWSMNRRAKRMAEIQLIAARRGVDIW